ncbi:hypothetical protein [Domibacillus epiphyticus]|uniref:Uncharacterized protein n=1 Tax=Domibacillus epiphyticus TaxID=1714355 RepID=A0A1V2AAL9_9BACI|nr:hypothetical protein [Domibacillus epiphyticus]OMP67844.1 hypothetical protein BTO28_04985 [Domibacillus epiphyticus]
MTPVLTGSLLIGTSVSGVFMNMTSLITVFMTAGVLFIIASFINIYLSNHQEKNRTVYDGITVSIDGWK